MTQNIAVFTGDLVNSTKATTSAVNAAMDAINAAFRSFALWSGNPDAKFTRFRGDGWQTYSPSPSLALRMALCLTAMLRAQDHGIATRIAIGIDPAASLGTETLADAGGPAFTASGHALDTMRKGDLISIAGSAIRGEDTAIAALLSERIARWSPEQAIAAQAGLLPKPDTLKDLAERLHISPQAISDRMRSAGLPAVKTALTHWEDAKLAQGWPGAIR